MNFEKFHSNNLIYITRYWEKTGGFDVPLLCIYKTFDKIFALFRSFNDENEMIFTLNLYRTILQYEKAQYYTMISESWRSEQEKDKPFIQPSKDPQRKSVLMIVSVNQQGKQLINFFEIKNKQLIPSSFPSDVEIDGYSTQLFKPFSGNKEKLEKFFADIDKIWLYKNTLPWAMEINEKSFNDIKVDA